MTFSLRAWLAALRAPATPLARALGALERGEAAAAIAGFTTVLHETADDRVRVLAYNKRGVAYVRQGERAQALRDFSEALALDPRCAPAITNVGNLLLEDGHLEDAIAHYEAALLADDTYATAHLNLGIAYRRAGRRGDAIREMRRANRLDLRRRRGPGDRRAEG